MSFGNRPLGENVTQIKKPIHSGEIRKGGRLYSDAEMAPLTIRRFCWGGQHCVAYVKELRESGLNNEQIAVAINAMMDMNKKKGTTKRRQVLGIKASQKPYRKLGNGRRQMRPLSLPMGKGKYTKGWRLMLPSKTIYQTGKTAVNWLKGWRK